MPLPLNETEKELAALTGRRLTGVAFVYGKESDEYEMASAPLASERG